MPSLLMKTTPPQRQGPRAFRSMRQGSLFVSGAPGVDLVTEVNLSNLTSGGGEECGLVYRLKSPGMEFWSTYINDTANLLKLSRWAFGAETIVATAAWPFAATAELRAIIQGGRHRIYVNGKKLIDLSDATQNTGTGAGLFSRNATAVFFEDFYAEGL